MRLALVQGTRPEILKNYPIVRALRESGVAFAVLHTNQHRHAAMRDAMYREMGYFPDAVLPGRYSIGATITWLQQEFWRRRIDHVMVNGDTAASLAGAVAALYVDVPVSHVEAGLRARDERMLEERNRIVVDAIANYLFAYTDYERALLATPPDVRGRIFVEGNTTVDLIQDFRHRIVRPPGPPYLFLTLHRRELLEHRLRLEGVLHAVSQIAERFAPVVFPVHPRTRAAIERHRLGPRLSPRVLVREPMEFFDSLSYQKHARLVMTDSGCVQEEAYILGTPCVTLRENTERHLTLAMGANRLASLDPERIVGTVDQALAERPAPWPEIYGSVGAGRRIVRRLLQATACPFPRSAPSSRARPLIS